ncbi:hypothetical protein C8R43DRAFT_1197659, partial [Mycena crocata]
LVVLTIYSFVYAYVHRPGREPLVSPNLGVGAEKLRMPPPERPNTSMGLGRDDTDSTLAESTRSIGIGRPSSALQKASTVASITSASSSTSSLPGETSKPTTSVVPPLKPMRAENHLSHLARVRFPRLAFADGSHPQLPIVTAGTGVKAETHANAYAYF